MSVIGMDGYCGTWRKYCVVKKQNLMVFPDEVKIEQIATSIVNPITVLAFYIKIVKDQITAAIQDGACSSLGKIFVKF
jgi:NADPH:quinone reductase-like Zn-dependent oxidoreductase